jgi:hypothetical protein
VADIKEKITKKKELEWERLGLAWLGLVWFGFFQLTLTLHHVSSDVA